MPRGVITRRIGFGPFGLVVATGMLIAALYANYAPRLTSTLVTALPGPGGITAELYDKRGADIHWVRLARGMTRVEVLRLEGPAPEMRWQPNGHLVICLGDAAVRYHNALARPKSFRVEIPVILVPSQDCRS